MTKIVGKINDFIKQITGYELTINASLPSCFEKSQFTNKV